MKGFLRNFTKLRCCGHFEGLNVSKSQSDQKLQHKSQMLMTTVFFNFGRKKKLNSSFKNGNFSTISGQFFAIYASIIHKTEILTVILRGWTGLNHNWFKLWHKTQMKWQTVGPFHSSQFSPLVFIPIWGCVWFWTRGCQAPPGLNRVNWSAKFRGGGGALAPLAPPLATPLSHSRKVEAGMLKCKH